MIRKLIKTHGKSIICPALTSVFLFVLSASDAPERANYLASFTAEGLVIISIYLISAREARKLKEEMNNNSIGFVNLLDSEIKKATELVSTLGDRNSPGTDLAQKHLEDLIKEKNDFTQKQIKKAKEESESIESKYRKAIKDTEDAEQEIEQKVNSFDRNQ